MVEAATHPPAGSDEAEDLARGLRSWLDHMRYYDAEFADAHQLRERSAGAVSAQLRAITASAAKHPPVLEALRATVAAVEATLPIPERVRLHVELHAPDAVLVSPLMDKGSPQASYLRAARALGIPNGLAVASWDNLTTTALIHGDPDLVAVWNEYQRDEAVRLHGIAAERVAVVGTPGYDDWFDLRPSTTREEFCARVGLPGDRPYILYVGSFRAIVPKEAAWIGRWIKMIRSAGSQDVAAASVLVRPHPRNPLDVDPEALSRLDTASGCAIHPRSTPPGLSRDVRQVFFDSLHHAAAVVGVNTTAMIEAAIARRGVHVLLAKRFREAHRGRPHFEHLVSAGGGLVFTARDVESHVAGLQRALRGEDAAEVGERSERFLRAFVRPQGLDTPSTPLMVQALESLARSPAPAAAPAAGNVRELEALRQLVGDPPGEAKEPRRKRRADAPR